MTKQRTLAAIALLQLPGIALADELHVPSQYPTIQAAIDAAWHGDDIFIAAGTYRELLNGQNKSLTFIGAGADTTIISADLDNDGSPDGDTLSYDNQEGDLAPFITITGIAFEDANHGFAIGIAGDINIAGCRFENCESAGFEVTRLVRDIHISDTAFVGGSSVIDGPYGIRTVSISGCRFIGLSGIPIDVSCSEFLLNDSVFSNNTGGIDISSSDCTVQSCNFEGNISTSGNPAPCAELSGQSVLVDNCNFISNGLGEEDAYGALNLSGSSVTVQRCLFKNNQGALGSAINANSTISVNDCIFELNFGSSTGPINAGSSSGTSYISNCQFINNGKLQSNTRRRPNGGGLCVERGHFIVEDSLFRGNITTNGGAIIALSDSSLWVNRCRFEANTANHLANGGAGGAIMAYGELAVTNSAFIGNDAVDGGGAITSSLEPIIAACAFIDNNAPYASVIQSYHIPSKTIRSSDPSTLDITSSIVVPTAGSASHFVVTSSLAQIDTADNIMTTDAHSIGFTRPPSAGGDGWGDDPTTPDIDEGANDDFGDLSLLPGSPAIDAGNNSNLPIDIYDLDGDGDETDFLIGDLDLAGNSRFSDIWQTPDAHSTGPVRGRDRRRAD